MPLSRRVNYGYLDAIWCLNNKWIIIRWTIKKNNDNIPTTASDSPTNNAKLTENLNELSDAEIASIMNPARLTQLLTQADAFTRVNSEDLDDF